MLQTRIALDADAKVQAEEVEAEGEAAPRNFATNAGLNFCFQVLLKHSII